MRLNRSFLELRSKNHAPRRTACSRRPVNDEEMRSDRPSHPSSSSFADSKRRYAYVAELGSDRKRGNLSNLRFDPVEGSRGVPDRVDDLEPG